MRVLFAAVLLALVLTPVMSRSVSADPLIDVDPIILDEVIDLPVEEVTPEPTLATIPDLDDVVIDEDLEIYDPSGEVNDIFINPIYCPYDLDLYSVDYYGLAAACNGLGHANGYELIVADSNGGWWLQHIIDNFGAGQSGLPNDTYYISLVHPASGMSYMRYICSADDMLGNDVVASFDVPNDGFGANLAISGGLMWYCDVFINQTGPSLPTVDVIVNKHGCPAGIYSDDMYFLASICHEMLTGIDFTLTDGYGNVYTQTTAGTPAMATFGQVAGGSISIQETIPAGYVEPVAFCKVEDMLGNNLGDYQIPAVSGGLFAVDASAPESALVFCDVYNFPEDPDGGSIIIIKRYCPADYDIFSNDPAVDCGQPQDGVTFTTTGPDGYYAQTNTGDSIPSAVFFGGLEAGEYQVAETLPAGVGSAWTWSCSSDTVDLSGFQPWDATGMSFVYDLAHDEDIVCFWYNIPTNDGHVTIHKWECPYGIELGHDVDFYLTECAQPMENVEFAQGQLAGFADLVYTDASGNVSFSVDANSDWAVEEHVPSGFGDPIVFCGWGGYKYDDFGGVIVIDGFASLDGTQGSLLEFQTYESFGMDCNWFNIPSDDDQHITVYKYTCPAGYDLDAATADPKADCIELTNGVNFHLLPDGGTELQSMTGDSINGAVFFGGVEYGKFDIWEDVPAGTVDTYVTCQWYDNLGPYVYQEFIPAAFGGASIGNGIQVELAQDDYLTCQWYNVPEKTWDGGDLTIYKYWCTGYVVTEANCELGSGVKFVVSPLGGGSPILTQTGPGGYVDVSGLTPGAYKVTEKDYEWCKAVSTKVDSDGNVVIEEGQETVLKVYNCTPEGKKNPPVKKFPDTGAGDLQPSADDEMILLGGMLVLAQVMMMVALRGKGVTFQSVVARIKR